MNLELLLNAAEFLEQREKCQKITGEERGLLDETRGDSNGGLTIPGTRLEKSIDQHYLPSRHTSQVLSDRQTNQYLSDRQTDLILSDGLVDRKILSAENRPPPFQRRQNVAPVVLSPPHSGGSSPTVPTGVRPHSASSSSLNSSMSSASSLDGSPVGNSNHNHLSVVAAPYSSYAPEEATQGTKVHSFDHAAAFAHIPSFESHRGRFPLASFLKTNGFAKVPQHFIKDSSTDPDENGIRDENKKRSIPSREVHNKLEKNRRAHLKECFEILKRQLPCMEDKKVSNQTILKAAQRYISTLKRKEREYAHEMERLARQKIAHQQRFSSLKRELQAKWDHIDFSLILPDPASVEQARDVDTKSTTTASEQPDADTEYAPAWSETNYPVPDKPNVHNLGSVNDNASNQDDSSQPLNLSTSNCDSGRANLKTLVNGKRANRTSPYAISYQDSDDKGLDVSPNTRFHFSPPLETSKSAIQLHPSPQNNTNFRAISPQYSRVSSVLAQSTHVKSNRTLTERVMTALPIRSVTSIQSPSLSLNSVSNQPPNNRTLTTTPVYAISHQISTAKTDHGVPTSVAIGGVVSNIISPLSSSPVGRQHAVSEVNGSVSLSSNHEASIPVVNGSGIPLQAQFLASGGVLNQPTIQVISPDGYKLVQTEQNQNGTKPLTIALTHSGLEHVAASGEDSKPTPLMVTVGKNGLSALHLTVPRSAPTSGGSVTASLPLNLSVGTGSNGGTATRTGDGGSPSKLSQAAPAPASQHIIPSYIPLTHTNGITQIVHGMSLVGPLVVSQAQRGLVVPGAGSSPKQRDVTATGTSSTSGSAGVSIVPAGYANAFPGGLVNSVVVVSTPGPGMVATQKAIAKPRVVASCDSQ